MNRDRISKSFMARLSIFAVAFGLLSAASPSMQAQTASDTLSRIAMLDLPDSPGAVRGNIAESAENFSSSAEPAPGRRYFARTEMSLHSSKVVLPGEQASPLTAREKFVMGVKDSVTPLSMAGWLISSGYSHLTNGPPNYGTDKGAFGQRLGATAIRDVSENVFNTSVMANVFHEDPRYYKMGRDHSIARRAMYAATRVLITKTDSGRATPNLALLTGNLAGAALTNAYYPPRNHGVSQTMLIFGSSVGGSALGFGVSEFLGDALELVHLKKSR